MKEIVDLIFWATSRQPLQLKVSISFSCELAESDGTAASFSSTVIHLPIPSCKFERLFGSGAFPVGLTASATKLSAPPSPPTSSPVPISAGGHQTNYGIHWPSPHTVHDILSSAVPIIPNSSASSATALCPVINNNHHHHNNHNSNNNNNNHHHNNNNSSGGSSSSGASNNNEESPPSNYHPHHHHHHQQYYASALYHHHHHRDHPGVMMNLPSSTPQLSIQSSMMQANLSQPASPCN